MAGIEGSTHELRAQNEPMYLKSGDMGMNAGGTVSGHSTLPSIQEYENIFGPVARDIKQDSQRHKRHQRWHLPDVLKGPNPFLTDRVDGLITDATNSPFTRNILPYVYLESPDQKLKWNVYSFDEGMASRVPYEAAARVLPQTKRSFAGYVVRQGLAIAMEHNFMMSQKGQENFKNQLLQLVGSIQLTNDLDVHVALLTAPSYQRQQNEKYIETSLSLSKLARRYVDMFGIMQKIPNALDFLIEDAKQILKTWGSQPPTFCMCNGKLQTQLTMLPERTNYITNGPDGAKRLAQGPELPSYRGLSFINTRKFSMETGTAPRDLLRRRVRVAEFYVMDARTQTLELYDQSEDSFFSIDNGDVEAHTLQLTDDQDFDLHFKAALKQMRDDNLLKTGEHSLTQADMNLINAYIQTGATDADRDRFRLMLIAHGCWWDAGRKNQTKQSMDDFQKLMQQMVPTNINLLNDLTTHTAQLQRATTAGDAAAEATARDLIIATETRLLAAAAQADRTSENFKRAEELLHTYDVLSLLMRPNIEHEMLAVIFGRGGTQELGCTFWGQTEMSCYDDAQHGIWGMSYKYHERAIVTNERNLVRVYDVAFDGYNGGMDKSMLQMNEENEVRKFQNDTQNKSVPYTGCSIVPFVIPNMNTRKFNVSSPLLFAASTGLDETENRENVRADDYERHHILNNLPHWCQRLAWVVQWRHLGIAHWVQPTAVHTLPGDSCIAGNSAQMCMAFQGTMRAHKKGEPTVVQHGSGHLGPSYSGVASVREGRGRMYHETMDKTVQLTHTV